MYVHFVFIDFLHLKLFSRWHSCCCILYITLLLRFILIFNSLAFSLLATYFHHNRLLLCSNRNLMWYNYELQTVFLLQWNFKFKFVMVLWKKKMFARGHCFFFFHKFIWKCYQLSYFFFLPCILTTSNKVSFALGNCGFVHIFLFACCRLHTNTQL